MLIMSDGAEAPVNSISVVAAPSGWVKSSGDIVRRVSGPLASIATLSSVAVVGVMSTVKVPVNVTVPSRKVAEAFSSV
jgi:hypothetical protein